MRCAFATLLVVGACSHRNWPAYSDAVAKPLGELASACDKKPGPPNGYDWVIDCHPPDDMRASVSIMLVDNKIGQLQLDVTEPSIDAALAKLEPAVLSVVDHTAFAAIAAQVRLAKPSARVQAISAPEVRAGFERGAVSVDFDWRTE